MEKTVFEYMKELKTPEDMQMFLYRNREYTRKGMKKLLEWLEGREMHGGEEDEN